MVNITDCTLSGNIATSGSGIYINSGTVSVNNGSVVDRIEGPGTTEYEVQFDAASADGHPNSH